MHRMEGCTVWSHAMNQPRPGLTSKPMLSLHHFVHSTLSDGSARPPNQTQKRGKGLHDSFLTVTPAAQVAVKISSLQQGSAVQDYELHDPHDKGRVVCRLQACPCRFSPQQLQADIRSQPRIPVLACMGTHADLSLP